jgi:ADP-ribosyl-[dinitrogen reductase] hydrolase
MMAAPAGRRPRRLVPPERTLERDLDCLRERHDAAMLVTLIERSEFDRLDLGGLLGAAAVRGIEPCWYPIEDFSVPACGAALADLVERILAAVAEGGTVVVHCLGGIGRTGLVAACCLAAAGREPEEAIAAVRRARPHTLETWEQEQFVTTFAGAWKGCPRLVGPVLAGDAGERARGALWGLAVGDALGAPFEFLEAPVAAARCAGLDGMVAGGGWGKGEWTDDTALALALARAYAGPGFAPERAARAMVDWLEGGPQDVGATTSLALGMIAGGGTTWRRAGCLAARGREMSAANGSLMRAAPTGLVRRPDDPRIVGESVALSMITHADPRCTAACVAFNAVLSQLVHRPGTPLDAALAAARDAAALVEPRVADLVEGVRAGAGARHAEEPIGYVLLCLERGLIALRDAESYAGGVREVIRRGGDTDTNAAVAGALLGARFGRASIPPRWLADLQRGEEIDAALRAMGVGA